MPRQVLLVCNAPVVTMLRLDLSPAPRVLLVLIALLEQLLALSVRPGRIAPPVRLNADLAPRVLLFKSRLVWHVPLERTVARAPLACARPVILATVLLVRRLARRNAPQAPRYQRLTRKPATSVLLGSTVVWDLQLAQSALPVLTAPLVPRRAILVWVGIVLQAQLPAEALARLLLAVILQAKAASRVLLVQPAPAVRLVQPVHLGPIAVQSLRRSVHPVIQTPIAPPVNSRVQACVLVVRMCQESSAFRATLALSHLRSPRQKRVVTSAWLLCSVRLARLPVSQRAPRVRFTPRVASLVYLVQLVRQVPLAVPLVPHARLVDTIRRMGGRVFRAKLVLSVLRPAPNLAMFVRSGRQTTMIPSAATDARVVILVARSLRGRQLSAFLVTPLKLLSVSRTILAFLTMRCTFSLVDCLRSWVRQQLLVATRV